MCLPRPEGSIFLILIVTAVHAPLPRHNQRVLFGSLQSRAPSRPKTRDRRFRARTLQGYHQGLSTSVVVVAIRRAPDNQEHRSKAHPFGVQSAARVPVRCGAGLLYLEHSMMSLCSVLGNHDDRVRLQNLKGPKLESMSALLRALSLQVARLQALSLLHQILFGHWKRKCRFRVPDVQPLHVVCDLTCLHHTGRYPSPLHQQRCCLIS